MEALIAGFGVLALMAMLVIYSSFSWGFVLYKFWAWFLLPVFPQVPHIGYWQAVGLMFFIGLFKNHNSDSIKDEYKDKGSLMTTAILAPWITLLAGWLISLFI